MLILDAHTHIGSMRNSEFSVAAMMEWEKQSGVSGAVFAPMAGVMAESDYELDLGNAEALELFEHYPDFLYPGVSVHPGYLKRSLYWLDAFRERNLVWCGEWLDYVCHVEFDDERWKPLFDYCQKYNMIVQVHNAPKVPAVAKRCPDLTIVGAHLNPDILPMLIDCPNVFVDVSGMNGGLYTGSLLNARAQFGASRLLFGTDTPGYDPLPFVARCKRDFPPEEFAALASGNLLNLLKTHGARRAFGRDLTIGK